MFETVVWKHHFSTLDNPRPYNAATVRRVSLVNLRELLRRWWTCPQSAVYFSVPGGYFGLQPLRLRVRGYLK